MLFFRFEEQDLEEKGEQSWLRKEKTNTLLL